MPALIRCIRDTGTNEPIYVNVDAVRSPQTTTCTPHFTSPKAITVKETLEKIIELISGGKVG